MTQHYIEVSEKAAIANDFNQSEDEVDQRRFFFETIFFLFKDRDQSICGPTKIKRPLRDAKLSIEGSYLMEL